VAAIESEGGDKVVTVRGEVDTYSAPQLRACLDEVVRSGQRRIVVDVSDVRFIDSSGVGVLVASIKRLRPDGRTLVLRQPTRQMTKVLEMTGLRELVAVD
jgi:anti-sigma B factor antagonist